MGKLTHVIEAKQFSRPWLEEEFFPLVEQMEIKTGFGGSNDLAGKRMFSFFYEPSTRTRLSFESAMDMLGGKVPFSTENAKVFSSVAKGECIEDTVRVLCRYKPDIIVLRTDQEGMAKRAAEFSTVPIINAGDGPGEHPTQAQTDLYTIKKEKGCIDGLSIALCGDLARSRTVRSLCFLLAEYDVEIHFIAPPEVAQIGNDVKEHLDKHKIHFTEGNDLREVAPIADVIYQTRIQEERGKIIFCYGSSVGSYAIDKIILDLMKKDAIIMHPLPRINEITREVDNDPRAAYFRQAENKLYIAMALLMMILT